MANPYFSLLQTCWKYAHKQRRTYIGVYILFFFANVVVALNPIFYGWFVGAVQKQGAPLLQIVWIYSLGFLGMRLVEWAFHGPARIIERKLAYQISTNYLDELFSQLVHLPAGWHKDHHSGSTINRLKKAYAALRDFFQSGFVYLQTLLKFVFSFAYMIYISPLFGLIGLLTGIFTFYVISRFDKPFIRTLKEVNEAEHRLSSNLFDSLSNIMTVITLRLEKRVHLALMDKVNDVFPHFVKNIKINEWKWFTAHMLVTAIYGEMVVSYVYQHYRPGQVFPLAGLVTLLGFVAQFTSVFYDFAQQYTQVVQFNTDIQTAAEITASFVSQSRPTDDASLPEQWSELHIRNLNYTHPVKNKQPLTVSSQGYLSASIRTKQGYGLAGMNLYLERGKRIALIGESGCGKSTLLALLRGLYEVKPGAVLELENGTPVTFNQLAGSVTLFPQEPEIFENTIGYNVTLGLPFDKEEIHEACRIACFMDVVDEMEGGIDSLVQEKGVNLSGGQKQRLALARGILAARGSSLILMDEPTSSMDPLTEQELYLNLLGTFEGKTVISSLHRLHLLKYFDYIYVLDKGHIAEEGTFLELFNRGPLFTRLWNHQQHETIQKAA